MVSRGTNKGRWLVQGAQSNASTGLKCNHGFDFFITHVLSSLYNGGGKIMLSQREIVSAYELVLGRSPESLAVIETIKETPELIDLVATLLGSAEYKEAFALRNEPFRYYYYTSVFDALATIRAHEDLHRLGKNGFKVNYFGVAIRNSFIPPELLPLIADREVNPIPCNWHADIAEFAACLRAVDLAGDKFTVAELGCNWGCWLNITGAAARRSGRRVHLIGIEGDAIYLNNARQSLTDNGYSEQEYSLIHAIIGAKRGRAAFPKRSVGDHWGLMPVFDTDRTGYAKAVATGQYDEMPMLGLKDISLGRIDLLHVDIQGGEAELIPACISDMNERVAYAMIGTHSREIEGLMFQVFTKAGWRLEIERPAILFVDQDRPKVLVDGVQGWRNPRLT